MNESFSSHHPHNGFYFDLLAQDRETQLLAMSANMPEEETDLQGVRKNALPCKIASKT